MLGSLDTLVANAVPPMSSDQLLRGMAWDGPSGPTGNQVAAFRLLNVVGQGGMGIVYRAQQEYPRRVVALKVMRHGVLNSEHAKRFEREITILARLQHPHISQLFSVGTVETDLGNNTPFLAMEFVDGLPITEYVSRQTLSLREKLDLMTRVCDAVAFAHERGVIHRDLKPSNILIDSSGQPKILDFGLATIAEDGQAIATTITQACQLLGTLDYMSPEQALGRADEIDRRTDVYSLGVILFEILTGGRPLDFSSCTVVEAVCRLKDSEISALSKTSRVFRGDLDIIAAKALAKDKLQRYPTASALADDLRRFLTHDPIQARRPTLAYRAKKFIRRHAVLVISIVLIFLSLAVGLIAAAREAHQANIEAASARANTQTARLQLANANIAVADILQVNSQFSEARVLYNKAWDIYESEGVSTLPAEMAIWELDTKSARPLRVLEERVEGVQCAVVSPDASWVALGFVNGECQIRDVASGETREVLRGNGAVGQLNVSPNGKTLLVRRSEGTEIWNMDGRTLVYRFTTSPFSESRIAVSDKYGVECDASGVTLIPLSSPKVQRRFDLRTISPFAVATDGEFIYILDARWQLTRIAMTNGAAKTSDLSAYNPRSAAFSSTGDELMLNGGSIHIIKLPENKEIGVIGHFAEASDAGFVSNDIVWLQNAKDSTVDFVDLSGTAVFRLPRPAASFFGAFGQISIAPNARGQLVLWSSPFTRAGGELFKSSEKLSCAALSHEGKTAAIVSDDQTVHLVDLSTKNEMFRIDAGAGVKLIRFSDDDRRLAFATTEKAIQLWDLIAKEIIFETTMSDSVRSMELTSGGAECVVIEYGSKSMNIIPMNGAGVRSIDIPFIPAKVAVSPDGRTCIIVGAGGGEVWNINDELKRIAQLQMDEGGASDVAFCGADTAMTMSGGSRVQRWNVRTGASIGEPIELKSEITSWAVSKSRTVLRSRFALGILDSNTLQESRRISLAPEKVFGIVTNAAGDKLLCVGRFEATVLDWSTPEKLRAFDAKQRKSEH